MRVLTNCFIMVGLCPELIDKIVEYVSTCDNDHEPYCSGLWLPHTDGRNLKGCARVSPAFLASSQRCLFRSVTVRFHRNAINMGFPQKPHLAAGVPTSFIHSALSSFPEVALINIDLHDYNCPVTDSDTFRSRKTLARLILDCSPKEDTVPATLMPPFRI
ncbi:hypothetical protein C8J57DRAFT_1518916 [Mycena rebaudengoi]|nr:hypothetical protein C8J57DRAFT_1518916 [Mycena rebaudengoi]